MRIVLSIILVFNVTFILAQQATIDSLKKVNREQTGLDRSSSLNELSWHYRNINIDSAFMFANIALEIAEEYGDKNGLQAVYNSLANIYDAVSKLDSAEIYHRAALEIRIELKDSANIAGSYNNLGILYDYKNLNYRALDMYFKALRIYETLDEDPYSIAMVLSNIGIVYKKQEDYLNVLEYYQKALEIYENIGSEFGAAVTNGNIGFVLINLKRFDESLLISKKALEAYENLGYTRYIPYIEQNIGIAYDSLKNRTKAEQYYKMALIHHAEYQNYYELANTELSYADFLWRTKNYKAGIAISEKALEDARVAEAADLIVNITQYLAKFNNAIGKSSEANNLYENYIIGRDSLFEKDKTKLIFELREQYEAEKKDKQLLAQEIDIKEKEAQNKLQFMLILLLIVVVILIYRWFYVKKQKQHINSQLALNQERNRIAMDLHDHVGAELTLVSSNLDVQIYDANLKNKQEGMLAIADQIRAIGATLRETVWSIHSQEIEVGELVSQVNAYASKLLAHSEISFKSNTNMPEHILSPQYALGLFRICQEAITNSFKHGEAKEIELDLSIENNTLRLKLSDDGKGYNSDNTAKGYGLENMVDRTKQLGGEIITVSNPDNGTCITIIV
jgi:signal transduction histidine kinase